MLGKSITLLYIFIWINLNILNVLSRSVNEQDIYANYLDLNRT